MPTKSSARSNRQVGFHPTFPTIPRLEEPIKLLIRLAKYIDPIVISQLKSWQIPSLDVVVVNAQTIVNLSRHLRGARDAVLPTSLWKAFTKYVQYSIYVERKPVGTIFRKDVWDEFERVRLRSAE